MKYKIGILAYGSLITNSGKEIEPLIIDKINCKTPFKVEFARTSKSRNGAPTLIPYETGNEVNAVILVLENSTDLAYAKSILYRRERHIFDDKDYLEITNPTINEIEVKCISEFENVETVIYTSLGKNIEGELTAEKLSQLAIKSILSKAGEEKKDGIRYLNDSIKNSITTTLSKDYEQSILDYTETKTLEEAIEKLDLQRTKKASR
jgi:predicted transcriptional regulator